ncbi:retron system putative HNH endonuclease [Coleofasciculus sp. H7-2]|uniref:retron system putative HNH endonuclease n=1 Tax=Coleofasciculus sp. H7-2 TaxID=3351545 RepID=UPI00366F6CC9
MRYIQKGEEPTGFSEWKEQRNEDWIPAWDNLSTPQKPMVHDALLREQGYICCYCGRRITRDTSHVEHLKPRKTYPNLALEYTNLLASCQRERERKEPLHCGSKKDDWYDEHLIVSPLDANCAEFFRYTDDGQIIATEAPEKKSAAQTTIDQLGLDIPKLNAMRRAAIEVILEDIDSLTDEEKQKLLQGFEQPDANG